MKKTKIDRSIDTEALGFQVRESYKTARTNIAYSIFKKGCKKVAFTSSTKGEGKTVTSINVASALAQQVGTKVIVVECDLRRPRVNTALKITPTPGLTNYLNEECSLEDIVKDTKIENLKAITYGAIPPNPSELLSSERTDKLLAFVKQHYDCVFIDTPPVNLVTDPTAFATKSTGYIMIVKAGISDTQSTKKAVDSLTSLGANIVGFVLNDATESNGMKYYSYGKYRGYKYKSKYGYNYNYHYNYR